VTCYELFVKNAITFRIPPRVVHVSRLCQIFKM